jgi:glycerophosphoryl diester phosphodiesterase
MKPGPTVWGYPPDSRPSLWIDLRKAASAMISIRLLPRLCLALMLTASAHAAEFPFVHPVSPPRRVEVIAHRGAWEQAPENSGTAIEHAISDVFEWVEVDLRLTADGHHVLLHDATLDRTTDGRGPVAALTLDALKRLDAGSKSARRFAGTQILTLDEALKLARGRINLCLDCIPFAARV